MHYVPARHVSTCKCLEEGHSNALCMLREYDGRKYCKTSILWGGASIWHSRKPPTISLPGVGACLLGFDVSQPHRLCPYNILLAFAETDLLRSFHAQIPPCRMWGVWRIAFVSKCMASSPMDFSVNALNNTHIHRQCTTTRTVEASIFNFDPPLFAGVPNSRQRVVSTLHSRLQRSSPVAQQC